MKQFFTPGGMLGLWAFFTMIALVFIGLQWGGTINKLQTFLQTDQFFRGGAPAAQIDVWVGNLMSYVVRTFNFDPKSLDIMVGPFLLVQLLVIVVAVAVGFLVWRRFDKALDSPAPWDEYIWYIVFEFWLSIVVYWAKLMEIPLLKETWSEPVILVGFLLAAIFVGSPGVTQKVGPFIRAFLFLNVVALVRLPRIFADFYAGLLGVGSAVAVLIEDSAAVSAGVWSLIGFLLVIFALQRASRQEVHAEAGEGH